MEEDRDDISFPTSPSTVADDNADLGPWQGCDLGPWQEWYATRCFLCRDWALVPMPQVADDGLVVMDAHMWAQLMGERFCTCPGTGGSLGGEIFKSESEEENEDSRKEWQPDPMEEWQPDPVEEWQPDPVEELLGQQADVVLRTRALRDLLDGKTNPVVEDLLWQHEMNVNTCRMFGDLPVEGAPGGQDEAGDEEVEKEKYGSGDDSDCDLRLA